MINMFNKFEIMCKDENIKFDPENQHVRCLAHIINLAVQSILKSLKAEAPNNENEILEEESSSITSVRNLGVVAKVRI
jgi:hypothetical protein